MQDKIETFLKDNISKYTYHQLCNILREEFGEIMSDEAIRKHCDRRGWKKQSPLGDDNYERNLFITCQHIPRHDEQLLDVFVKFKKFFKPHRLWILGDFVHLEQLSKYRKDPEKRGQVQKDLDLAADILDQIIDGVDKVEFCEGNHEDRLRKFLWDFPGLFGLRCLTIPALLQFSKRNIRHRILWEDDPTTHFGFQVHHGKFFRKHSGWSAKAHWEEWGGCGIHGHCHRGGNYLRRRPQQIDGWYEDMCMCDLKPGYGGFHNWIQGWSIAYFTKKGLFHLEQIPVIDHEFLFQGKLFSV